LKARGAAEAALENALKHDYPPGTTIRWSWGRGRHVGTVVRNSYGDRIQVRNDLTGKTRWISAFNII
jgi:hypothetical protein